MEGEGSGAASAGTVRAREAEAEAEWIRRARTGDREAFGRLVELHQDAVMTAAYYMTGDREDAADISQETFLRAFRSLAGFAGESTLRTWLLVIAANASHSLAARRRTRKRGAATLRIDAGEEPIDVADAEDRGSPEALSLRTELKEAIEAEIARLDPEARALVVLRDLLGESYEAIAAARRLPVGTVKSRIHRARLDLRERLRKYL